MKTYKAREARRKMQESLTSLIKAVSRLGLVDSLILATNSETAENRFFVVLKKDTSAEEMGDPRFTQLTNLLDQLEIDWYLELNATLLNPSKLDEITEVCRALGYKVRELKIKETDQ